MDATSRKQKTFRVEQLAIDFITGMTDRYAINLYERLFVPRAWV